MTDKARKTVKQEAAEHGVKLDERVRKNYPDKAEGTAREWLDARGIRHAYFDNIVELLDAYTAALQRQLAEAQAQYDKMEQDHIEYIERNRIAKDALQTRAESAEALAKERGERLAIVEKERDDYRNDLLIMFASLKKMSQEGR